MKKLSRVQTLLLAALGAKAVAVGLALLLSSPLASAGPAPALAQEKPAAASPDKKAEAKPAPAAPADAKAIADDLSKLGGEDQGAASQTPQYDPRVINLIEQKRAELEQEEDRLTRQRQELEKLQLEVNQRIDELKKVQAALEELVKTEQTQRQDRLQQLVKVLTNMRPASAAAVMAKLDDQMAMEVFSRMQSRAAGALMGALKPDQAARISELLTRQKESQRTGKIAEEAATQGAQPPPPPPKK